MPMPRPKKLSSFQIIILLFAAVILAGALLGCGTGQLPLSAVEEALRTGRRDLLGKTMPAKGLTLLAVDYGFPLFCGNL